MLPAAKRIRVLLVMDDAMVRTGLRMLIESWQEMGIVGESCATSEALVIASREKPDIAICDTFPAFLESNTDFLPVLVNAMQSGGVILLAGDDDPAARLRAIRAGVHGIVYKGKAVEELRTAISKVYSGELWLDRLSTAKFILQITRASVAAQSDPAKARISSLTEREHQIASLICQGLQNEQIGRRLSISDTTVRHHLTSIFVKIGVSNRLELTVFLYRNNFPGTSLEESFASAR